MDTRELEDWKTNAVKDLQVLVENEYAKPIDALLDYFAWSPEVYSRIDPVITEVGARVRQIPSSKAEGDIIRYSLVDESLFNQLEPALPFILAVTLRGLIHKFGDDTTSLLHPVHRTPPKPGQLPLFSEEEGEP